MRAFCYECFRPEALCLCGHIPNVPNMTEITVLQHARERFHPFGSVRMLMHALERGRLEVAYRGEGKDVHRPLSLPPRTGLLYPRPDATELAGVDQSERPANLVLLDGTWSQAHRLYRDNPWLQELPHYRIHPAEKSRYLVRREPKDYCLSTLEAAVLALRELEPDLIGLDRLLEVFVRMNVEQVETKSKRQRAPRQKRVRRPRFRAVPEEMLAAGKTLVVAYGESAEMATRKDPKVAELFQWAAMRLGSGETFSGFARPGRGTPSATHLERLGLHAAALSEMVEPAQLGAAFRAFLQPTDVLLVWNRGTLSLLPEDGQSWPNEVLLKGAYCNARGGRCGLLEDVVEREGLASVSLPIPGRARIRLGNAAAVAVFLRGFAQERLTALSDAGHI